MPVNFGAPLALYLPLTGGTLTGGLVGTTLSLSGSVSLSTGGSAPATMGLFNYGGISLGFRAGSSGYSFFNNAVGVIIMSVSDAGALAITGGLTVPGSTTAALTSTATFTSGAGASVGTLTNAPSVGNPTSWIKIVDNGVTRYIPAW